MKAILVLAAMALASCTAPLPSDSPIQGRVSKYREVSPFEEGVWGFLVTVPKILNDK